MKTIPLLALGCLAVAAHAASGAVKPGAMAHYRVLGAAERDAPPISGAWVLADGSEKVGAATYQWWRMVLKKQDGSILGVRALSERVPMTSDQAPGDMTRYIFSPKPGIALEYVDRSTGKALLPELELKRNFLPRPGPDARYPAGFATAGELLGHFVWLAEDKTAPPAVDFSDAQVLNIRTDFNIGTSRTFRDDGTPPGPDGEYRFVPWTQQDLEDMIAAGFNYFASIPAMREWMLSQPAFVAGGDYAYPDDFYRSNVLTAGMYIDEPQTRLGRSGGISGPVGGPEQVAQALRMRVLSHEPLRGRILNPTGAVLGTLELVRPRAPSWETEFTSSWYQMQAGAPGIVHEGRYNRRGYGWHPAGLVGQGLDGLEDRDILNFFYAFLRGAARSFDGDWGTSLYGQSDPEMRFPAFIRAYQMGAKYLWFWTSDHGHHVPFAEQIRLASAISDYAREHPRPDRRTLIRQAAVGIALPPGYDFDWYGTWGKGREDLNPFGVSYGDISAAALWEGIICSRRGIEYDYLIDHPGIGNLGYERLAIVREDGTVKVTPPWPETRVPKAVRIDLEPEENTVSKWQTMEADFRIERAGNMKIDGDLSDWANAEWIEMGGDEWFGDSFDLATKLKVAAPVTAVGDRFQGFSFEPLTPELTERYALEAYPFQEMTVITAVEPGSPADQAGLRVGDIIDYFADRRLKSSLQIHRWAQRMGDTGVGQELGIGVTRSGRSRYDGPADLSAQVAFLLDERYLYFAAKVTDDVHVQAKAGPELWMHDSVQLSIDPMLARTPGNYGEDDHELGMALEDGQTSVWRWEGRRGQPTGPPVGMLARAVRETEVTLYEAAIPIHQIMPFAPDLWPKCGIDVVINDTDGVDAARKGRLELVPGGITHGKHPDEFPVFECARSGDPNRVSAGLVWRKRCMLEGGATELTLVVSSPQAEKAVLRSELTSLGTPPARPATHEMTVPVTSQPQQYRLKVSSGSPAGRYRLKVTVKGEDGRTAAEDALSVFIYPDGERSQ